MTTDDSANLSELSSPTEYTPNSLNTPTPPDLLLLLQARQEDSDDTISESFIPDHLAEQTETEMRQRRVNQDIGL